MELVLHRRPVSAVLNECFGSGGGESPSSSRGGSPVRPMMHGRPGSSSSMTGVGEASPQRESPVRRAFYLQRSSSSSTSILGLR
jgi:hypothetical protein